MPVLLPPTVSLEELRLDEATWRGGSAERQHEWSLAIHELVQEGSFEPREGLPRSGLKAVLRIVPGRVVIDVAGSDGVFPPLELPTARMVPLMDEYMQTIREMSKLGVGSNSPRLEALDIAKRLTHDEAGEAIVEQLRALGPDHGTARRLFTLLVTLFHDTTKLAAPPHRLLY